MAFKVQNNTLEEEKVTKQISDQHSEKRVEPYLAWIQL